VSTDKGLAGFNGFMSAKSYVEGWSFTPSDAETFGQITAGVPDPTKYPHAYRWYVHVAALQGVRGLSAMSPPVSAASAPAPAAVSAPSKKTKKDAPASSSSSKEQQEDDDFDVFGEDEDDAPKEEEAPAESRADMLARLRKEAEERAAAKELKQRTLVALEIKPWDIEQDLMALWKKIVSTINQDGLKWGQNCTLADVAYGIKKIQTTFVMGVSNSSDDVVDAILALEDEVQSCEVTSMSVL
jgi:elongation factor 1-beta